MTPLEKAESDYTKAVETAARTGDWAGVAAAHQALHQTRNTDTQAGVREILAAPDV